MIRIYTDGSTTATCIYPDGGYPSIIPFTGTVNEAEYEAIQRAVEYALDQGGGEVEIISDSELAVNQLSGRYAIRAPNLRERAQEIWNLCKGLKVRFLWVPRDENKAGKVLG